MNLFKCFAIGCIRRVWRTWIIQILAFFVLLLGGILLVDEYAPWVLMLILAAFIILFLLVVAYSLVMLTVYAYRGVREQWMYCKMMKEVQDNVNDTNRPRVRGMV